MQLHELKPSTPSKSKKRVGRGGKRGTYSGRGQKGQKARAGAKIRPGMREALISTPKKRGYKNKRKSPKAIGLSLNYIQKLSEETITREVLEKSGAVKRGVPIKILGSGNMTTKKNIVGIPVSKTAKEKIETVGGSVS